MSQRLTNSVTLTPGPNVNKPRVARPQDTAYQSAARANLEKEKDENEEGVKKDEKDMFKIFSHLANVLNETAKRTLTFHRNSTVMTKNGRHGISDGGLIYKQKNGCQQQNT